MLCLCVPRSRRFLDAFPHTAAKMFTKDSSFQVTLRSVPETVRVAIREHSLDQPGVLVAFIEDVLEDGTDGWSYGIGYGWCC